jgi:hypothetical protein
VQMLHFGGGRHGKLLGRHRQRYGSEKLREACFLRFGLRAAFTVYRKTAMPRAWSRVHLLPPGPSIAFCHGRTRRNTTATMIAMVSTRICTMLQLYSNGVYKICLPFVFPGLAGHRHCHDPRHILQSPNASNAIEFLVADRRGLRVSSVDPRAGAVLSLSPRAGALSGAVASLDSRPGSMAGAQAQAHIMRKRIPAITELFVHSPAVKAEAAAIVAAKRPRPIAFTVDESGHGPTAGAPDLVSRVAALAIAFHLD